MSDIIVKGAHYYIKGLSIDAQLRNVVQAKFVEMREATIAINDENITTYYMVASENKTTWYPANTLTKNLGE